MATQPDRLLFGADGGLPPGYVRFLAGTPLLRGHSPDKQPDWFGPAIGAAGTNRFDVPVRTTAADPGTCYLARSLQGVLLERVLRGVWRPVLSRRSLSQQHAITSARVTRDLVLIDLCLTMITVHQLDLHDISEPPPYARTQALAQSWAAQATPVRVDGILYASRFAPSARCLAVWDRAAGALQWGSTERLGARVDRLARACQRLGIGLIK